MTFASQKGRQVKWMEQIKIFLSPLNWEKERKSETRASLKVIIRMLPNKRLTVTRVLIYTGEEVERMNEPMNVIDLPMKLQL